MGVSVGRAWMNVALLLSKDDYSSIRVVTFLCWYQCCHLTNTHQTILKRYKFYIYG